MMSSFDLLHNQSRTIWILI